MVRLVTPVGMLATVALLAVYAAYAVWTALIHQSSMHAAIGVIALTACVGTAQLRQWSQYLVHALTALFVGAWCHSVIYAAKVGFFGAWFASNLEAARSMAPGLILAVLSVAASITVYRHFRRRPPTT